MTLYFCFSTDGDFYLDKEYFDKLLNRMTYNCSKSYTYESYADHFSIHFPIVVFNKDEEETLQQTLYENMVARDITEYIIKSIRFHHMFLMRDLYNLNEDICRWLFHKPEETECTFYWSGNYDGTEINITR